MPAALLLEYSVTLHDARAVPYQAVWRDFHIVRGHGFTPLSFCITESLHIADRISTNLNVC